MFALRFLAATLAAGLVAAPGHAKDPVTLQPLSDWEMADPSSEVCTVVRFFGSEDNIHVLRLEQNWPSSGVELWAVGSAFRYFTNYEEVKLQLREGGRKAPLRPVTGMLPGFGKAVITGFSPRLVEDGSGKPSARKGDPADGIALLDPASGASAQFLSLQRGSDPAVRLATASLQEPFTMLRACSLNLLGQWGLDPDKHQSAMRGVRLRNQAAINRKFSDAFRVNISGERGLVNIRLIVDETGKMRDCAIIKSAATDNLASPVCRIMAGAAFDPALDAQGRPFTSFYATSLIVLL